MNGEIGRVPDLSEHFRGFSFEKTNADFEFVPDRDYMYDFLTYMDIDPSGMSNDEIEIEYMSIVSGDVLED